MNGHEILKLGYPRGVAIGLALKAAQAAKAANVNKRSVLEELASVLANPEAFAGHAIYGPVAAELLAETRLNLTKKPFDLDTEAPYRVWGQAQIEPGAIEQLKRAVRLPVAVQGALMPDAHVGYGLPIGGVLATRNSVIPYAVGVDIACRMRLTIFDASPFVLERKKEKFRKILENNTAFGTGVEAPQQEEHEVMDDPLWREHPVAKRLKALAWRQLGTSG